MVAKPNRHFIIPIELSQADQHSIQSVMDGLGDLLKTKRLNTQHIAALGNVHMALCAYVLAETCYSLDAVGIIQDAAAKEVAEEYRQHRDGVFKPRSGDGEPNGD